MVDPLTNTTQYAYDGAGNVITMTDANLKVTVSSYDLLNRQMKIDYPAPDVDVLFQYDGAGQRTVMTDTMGVTTWAYDLLSRPLAITQPFTGTVIYAFDSAGNRLSTKYPDGKVITDTYDLASRLVQVQDWQSRVVTYTYNAAGQALTTSLPNGVTTQYGYDSAQRLATLTHNTITRTLASFAYTLDAIGNRTSVTETVQAPDGGTSSGSVGDQNIETGQDSNSAGLAEAFQYTATGTGPVNQLFIYLDASSTATQVVVGLYTDSSNNPGSLLTQGTISSPTAGAWNSVSVSSANITTGTKYWIAVLGPVGAGTVHFRDSSSGGNPQGSSQANLTSLPATWSSGTSYPASTMSAYAAQASSATATVAITYTYDPLYRLTEAIYSDGHVFTYTYDAVGNRLTQTTLSGTTVEVLWLF